MIGRRLRALRKAKGWSQDELARRVKLTKPYLSMLGLGQPCAVCDEAIPSRHVEYEIEHAVGVKLIVRHFHRRCYAVWELERDAG